MKAFFFNSIMALAIGGLMGIPGMAQDDWNQPTQISSYQDILARAGYADRHDYPKSVTSSESSSFGTSRESMIRPAVSSSFYQDQDVGGPGPRTSDLRRMGLDQPPVDSANATDQPVESGCDLQLGGAPGLGCDTGSGNWGGWGHRGDSGACAGEEVFDAPVYRPGSSWRRQASACRPRNFVLGVGGLVFDRDYEDDVPLSYNPAGVNLRSTDADLGTMGGFQIDATTRSASGRGYQAVFWTLLPGSTTRSLWGSYNTTRLTGLSQLVDPGTGQYVDDIYNVGNEHRIIRSSSLYNLELNVLRNGGKFQTARCRTASYELVMGFRWFQFDEDFSYRTYTPLGGYPSRMDYDLDVNNTLLGAQLGGKTEMCLSDRFRLMAGTKMGIFNNYIQSDQSISDTMTLSQIAFGPYAGTDYSFMDDKNDIAFLGELDLGLLYLVSCNTRLNVGYRAVGISGIALALNQIPSDFTYIPAIRDINSNGSLLLHGAYFGLEHCF